MNSKKDRQYIVSYFCILLLLCGVRTINYIYCEDVISDRMQSCDLDTETEYPDSQYYMADEALISKGSTARDTFSGNQYLDTISAQPYSKVAEYFGSAGVSLKTDVVPVIFAIIAVQHLLC